MIKQKTNRAYKSSLIKHIHEELGDNVTGDEVIEYLIEGNFDYEVRQYSKSRKTIYQRLFFVFFIILFLFIGPVQWIVSGKVGVSSNSKFGRKILDITGKR